VAVTRYNRIMKRLLPLLAVPALLLAGCSGGNDTTATPAPGTTSSVPSDTTATTSPPGASSSGLKPSSSSGTGKATRCHTGDLSVKVGNGDAGAGTYHINLIFTDKSKHRCTLRGYPGVSWVTGEKGTQVNNPFQRTGGTKTTVTLAPGEQARAVLVTHDAANFPTSHCKPVSVRGYRVYPPDETASIFVSAAGKQCSNKGVNVGQVLPIGNAPGVRSE
jgi:hypothetical protein